MLKRFLIIGQCDLELALDIAEADVYKSECNLKPISHSIVIGAFS